LTRFGLAIPLLFIAVIGITSFFPDAFAAFVTVQNAPGSSVPGCEETNECFLPYEVRVDVGDTVTWVNDDTAAHTTTAGSPVEGPSGVFDSGLVMAGSSFSFTFNEAGTYEYFCAVHPWMSGVVIVQPSSIIDNVPPLIIVPDDIVVDATASFGATVSYSVKGIDNIDGIVNPQCSPSPGSVFPIGDTIVSCFVSDRAGNSVSNTFMVTVESPDVLIPDWVRDVAAFWCNDEIDDSGFIEAIQYLIDNNVIIVPATQLGLGGTQEVPLWVKNNACWWFQGLISDNDFAAGIQFLIKEGIIRV